MEYIVYLWGKSVWNWRIWQRRLWVTWILNYKTVIRPFFFSFQNNIPPWHTKDYLQQKKPRYEQMLKHVLAEECTRPLLCPLYLPLAALPLASLKAFQQQQLTTTTRPGQSGYELCVIMVAKQHSLTTCSTLASFSCFLWAYKMQSPAVPNREKGLLCCA